MKKASIIVVLVVLLTGCSNNSKYIDELETTNQLLRNDIDEIKTDLSKKVSSLEEENNELKATNVELQETIKKNEEERNSLVVENEKLSTTIDELNKLVDRDGIAMYNSLKYHIYRYFEIERYNYVKRSEKYVGNDDITVNGINLYMTQSEVKEILGSNYTETITYEEASGYFLVRWNYEDGTTLEFNPIYLISISFSNPEFMTSYGVQVGTNAKDSLELLDNLYNRYSNIHMLDNSIDLFDFYYDKITNTVIYVQVDEKILNYDEITDKSVITRMTIADYAWQFFN